MGRDGQSRKERGSRLPPRGASVRASGREVGSPVPTSRGPAPVRGSWFSAKRPVLRFVVLAGIWAGVFYFFVVTPFGCGPVHRAYMGFHPRIAQAGGAVLAFFGEEATVTGAVITSPRFSVRIVRGCDGLEALAVLGCAILAFPASIPVRLGGLVVGTAVLMSVNLVRVVSLFYIGIHFPRRFEMMHKEVWQPMIIFVAVVLFILWARWATRWTWRRPHAAA